MVVKIDDARIEVELDVRRALGDLGEIESRLERARRRRGRGRPGAEPGGERRPGGRRLLAPAAVGAAAARAGGGLRRAVGFAAKLGGGLTVAEVIRNAPEIVRAAVGAVVGEEALETRLLDVLPVSDFVKEILAANVIGVTSLASLVDDLAKRIAQLEGGLKTTAKAAVLAYDLLRLGQITEAGAGAIALIKDAISPGGEPVDPATAEALGITAELLDVFDAFQAYNTAESLFKQRARGLQIRGLGDNLDGLFRAPGGGAGK